MKLYEEPRYPYSCTSYGNKWSLIGHTVEYEEMKFLTYGEVKAKSNGLKKRLRNYEKLKYPKRKLDFICQGAGNVIYYPGYDQKYIKLTTDVENVLNGIIRSGIDTSGWERSPNRNTVAQTGLEENFGEKERLVLDGSAYSKLDTINWGKVKSTPNIIELDYEGKKEDILLIKLLYRRKDEFRRSIVKSIKNSYASKTNKSERNMEYNLESAYDILTVSNEMNLKRCGLPWYVRRKRVRFRA